MEPNHRPGPAPAPQEPPHHRRAQRPSLRRRSKLGMFFTAFGILAFGVLLVKYALIPLLVWVQALVGGAA